VAARRWLVGGRVQGVGFRYFVSRGARRLGVTGRVRNLPDGRVEVEVVGDVEALEELKAEVKVGPPGARVTALVEQDGAPHRGWDSFEIDH
jgi:acylphosphatase